MNLADTLAVLWAIEKDGDNWYVQEKVQGDKGYLQFGPIPRDEIAPFIAARKTMFQQAFAKVAISRKNENI